MLSPTMVTSVTFVAGLILSMSTPPWSVSSLVSAAVTTTRNYDNLSSLTLNDNNDEEDGEGDEYFGLGRQMKSQRAFAQLESSGGQQGMSQGPRGVDDAVKHSTPRNKTKRPTPLVPFLNTLQSSSQEINSGSLDGTPEGKDGVALSATKLPNSYYVEGIGDSINGPSGSGSSNSGNSPHLIRCVCNTSDCVPRNNNGGNNGTSTTCLTSGMCYTQILDYGDGRPPVSKGCISGENLLCENRRPKNIPNWPRVKCCSSDMCNAGAFPPRRTKLSSVATISAGVTTSVNHGNVIHESVHDEKLDVEDAGKDAGGRHEKIKSDNHPDNEDAIGVWTNLDLKKKSLDANGRVSPLISPLASSFLIGGAVVVIVISAIGFYILRREQRHATLYYSKDLERRGREAALGSAVGDEHEDEDREADTNHSHSHSHNHCIKETCLNDNLTSAIIRPKLESDENHSHLLPLSPNPENMSTTMTVSEYELRV